MTKILRTQSKIDFILFFFLEIINNNEDGEEDYEPPANTMEELLFRELAVLKLGVSR